MSGNPVTGNVDAATKPNSLLLTHVLQKTDQTDRSARTANKPVVQSDRHELGLALAFAIQQVEAVTHIFKKLLGRTEAIVVAATIIVRFVGIRNDEMGLVAHFDPIWQLVALRIAVVQDAVLDYQPTGVIAGPSCHPALGSLARQCLEPLNSELDMLTLYAFWSG